MKKGAFFAVAAAILAMSGCDVTMHQNYEVPRPTDITFIRWGMVSLGGNEGKLPFAQLNERLEAEGSDIRVEAVEIDMGFDDSITFDGLVKEYEKENGSLDILTYGSDWASKTGTVNIFIENGYFRELSDEDKTQFTDIPDICWSAAKVNGKHYTIPALNFGINRDVGIFFYFNEKYISKNKLQGFDCTIEELENILDGTVLNEDLTGIDFQIEYLDFTGYTPASQKGGLYLSDKTLKAVNPYETQDVIEYARTINNLYKKGYMNYDINFSEWDSDKEYLKTDFAVKVCGGRADEETLKKRLGKDYNVFEYSRPYYMENRLLYSTGIPTGSAHPDKAMTLLKRLHTDKELSALLTKSERDAIGLPRDNEPVDTGEIKLSPFAEFELKYTDFNTLLMELLSFSFDRLCKSENFDKTLEEINAELKAAGIDEYVGKVNKLLEESLS